MDRMVVVEEDAKGGEEMVVVEERGVEEAEVVKDPLEESEVKVF